MDAQHEALAKSVVLPTAGSESFNRNQLLGGANTF